MTQSMKKINWQEKISNAIAKVFSLVKAVIRFAWEVVMHCMSTITFFFTFLLKVVADPSTPCVVAIVFFIGVSAVAAAQWWGIGVWAGQLFGISNGLTGMGMGATGMLFGFGINIFQLSPQLWRLRKDVARAYGKLAVNPHFEGDEETIQSKNTHWFSYDHRGLKGARLVSYGLETSIVLGYCAIAQSLAFSAIIQAAVSLLLPEKSLQLLSNAVSLMGAVSEEVTKPADDEPKRQPQSSQQSEPQQKRQPQ